MITSARERKRNRYLSSTKNNGNISNSGFARHIMLSADVGAILNATTEMLNLSGRSYFKVIKVARTVTVFDQSEEILPLHLAEALQYRQST